MKAVYFSLLCVSALACASAESIGYDSFGEFAQCYYTAKPCIVNTLDDEINN